MLYNINIQEIRLAMFTKGITNKKMAEVLDIATSSVGRKLKGTSEFTIRESQVLCEFLNLDPCQIFFTHGVPNMQQKPYAEA